MPLHNLIQEHISDEDMIEVDKAIEIIETRLINKVRNLSAEERQRYGSIKEKNKLVVNKVWDYRTAQPDLSSPDVDWSEFEADMKDRLFFETRTNRLFSLAERMTNAKILHDWDNYQNSLTDYDYTKYKANTQAGGFATKRDELAQFFEKSASSTDGSTNDATDSTTNKSSGTTAAGDTPPKA